MKHLVQTVLTGFALGVFAGVAADANYYALKALLRVNYYALETALVMGDAVVAKIIKERQPESESET